MRHTVAALLALTVAACASAPAGDQPNRNVITADQIAAIQAGNAFDAVQKLEPGWLNPRGPSSVTDPTPTVASVFMNGTHVGDIDYLRNIGVIEIREIRYFPAGQASARFGIGHPRGVIEVITGAD
jgi:hypothetical protein